MERAEVKHRYRLVTLVADAQAAGDMNVIQGDAAMVPTCRIDDQCEPSEYCFEAEDGTKRCRSGCREDGCEEGRTCDLTLRVCVRDTSCEDDEGCFFGEYCDDGMCVDGCRLNDAEACPRNEDGLPTACDLRREPARCRLCVVTKNNNAAMHLPMNVRMR